MISGRVVLVVGTSVVVEVVVEVEVDVVMTETSVVSATTVGAGETLAASRPDPEVQAEAISSSDAKPRATEARRKLDIPSKYPLRRTKCWRSQYHHTFSHHEPSRGCFAFSSERIGP